MKRLYRIGLLLLVIFWAGWLAYPATAAPGEQPVPPGFNLVLGSDGVALYQKNYAKGSPDYVQVADLSRGAQLHVLHGKIVEGGESEGVYGGDNPRFSRKSIQQFWQSLESNADQPFCVTNGQFFRLADSPTPLPFPLKVNGEILSDGYGTKEFPHQKLMLEIWPGRLDIRPLTQENLYESSAPDIVAGLTEDAEKASKKAVGRTFVGIADRDGDRMFESLYVFTTQIARPAEAAAILREFGATKVMMLDGGGSTQLVCGQEALIDTDRLIPQALGISAGHIPEFVASLAPADGIPIVIGGETLPTNLIIHNQGSDAWQPGDTQLIIQGEAGQTLAALNLPEAAPPGEQASFAWLIPAGEHNGLQQAQLSISVKDQTFPVQAGSLEWIALPADLREKQVELASQVKAWSANPEIDLAVELQSWLLIQQAQIEATIPQEIPAPPPLVNAGFSGNFEGQVNIGDAAWIPLLMIPVIGLMIAVVKRIQQFQT